LVCAGRIHPRIWVAIERQPWQRSRTQWHSFDNIANGDLFGYIIANINNRQNVSACRVCIGGQIADFNVRHDGSPMGLV
jgi:hypothetical protein